MSGPPPPPHAGLRSRRGLAAALVLLAAGGLLVLLGGARTWLLVVPAQDGLSLPAVALTGADLLPAGTALGLVLLAGAVGVVATRGRGRRAVAVVLALTAIALAWGAVRVALAPVEAARQALAGVPGGAAAQVDQAGPWWAVTLAGAALALAGAGLTWVGGPSWPGMSARYERTGAAATAGPGRAAPTATAAAAWDALDRGEDPTA